MFDQGIDPNDQTGGGKKIFYFLMKIIKKQLKIILIKSNKADMDPNQVFRMFFGGGGGDFGGFGFPGAGGGVRFTFG